MTIVTLIPAFSTHYNGVIAASLFFPMTFSSIALLLLGRFLVRLLFYLVVQIEMIKLSYQAQTQAQRQQRVIRERGIKNGELHVNDWKGMLDSNKEKRKQLKDKMSMIAFHRPFRKLSLQAVRLSLSLCILYAHCWSRTMSLFKVSSDDGAGALCRAVFTPFATNHDLDGIIGNGAHGNSIWIIWLSIIVIMILSFAQDEWNGLHSKVGNKGNVKQGDGEKVNDDAFFDDSDHEYSTETGESMLSKNLKENNEDQPKDTLEMVSLPFIL